MEISLQHFLAGIVAIPAKIWQGLEEGNSGVPFLYLWALGAFVSLHLLGLVFRVMCWQRTEAEARIVGVDFSKPNDPMPVCEYKAVDGAVVRACFNLAIPSFTTGHKIRVLVDRKNPHVITTLTAYCAFIALGLAMLAMSGSGFYQTYLLSESASAWLAASSGIIVASAGLVAILHILSLPFDKAGKRKRAERDEKLQGAPLRDLSDPGAADQHGKNLDKFIKTRKCVSWAAIVVSCLISLSAFSSLFHALQDDIVVAKVVEPRARLHDISVEWESPSGKKVMLYARYSAMLAIRPPLKKSDSIRLRADAAALESAGTRARVFVETAMPLVVLDFMISVLFSAAIFVMGLCLKPPPIQRAGLS